MKKLSLLTALLFCAIISFAQFNPVKTGAANQQQQFQGALQGRLGFMLPIVDTTNNPATPYFGALTTLPSDSAMDYPPIYMSNSRFWFPFGSGFNINDTIYTKLPIYVYVDSLGRRVIAIQHDDGILGGTITQSDCWDITITPIPYYLNYLFYLTSQTTLTIDTADATFGRYDLIVVDTFATVSVIKGTPSATPAPPDYNYGSQLVRTTIFIPAGATCLPINLELIYDEDLQTPAEWDTSRVGGIDVDFDNTDNPFRGTKDIFVRTYTDGSQLVFTNDTYDTATIDGVVFAYIYLNGYFYNRFTWQLYNDATPVGNPVTFNSGYGLNPADSNNYQLVAPTFQDMGLTNQVYNKLVITLSGDDTSGAKGYFMDYINIQAGINNFSFGNGVINFEHITDSIRLTLTDGRIFTVVDNNSGGGGTVTDTSFQWSVLDSLSTPPTFVPGQFVEGNKYLVGTAPTGLFVGHENNIATYDSTNAIYTFDTASIGDLLYNATTDFVSKLQTGVTWVRVGRPTLHQGGDTYAVPIVMGSRDNYPTTFLVNNGLAGSIGTTSTYNTSLGVLSLPATSFGTRNTGLGAAALGLNTSGINNTGLGYATNYHNIIGNDNTAVGWGAVGWNRGDGNTAVGYSALNSTVSVIRDAIYNTAIGYQALQNNGDHAYNIGLGVQAGQLSTTIFNPIAKDSTLYISNFTTHQYFRIDSVTGTAPRIIGTDTSGFWHSYENTGGGGGSDTAANGELYQFGAGTPITVTTAGTYYKWETSTVGLFNNTTPSATTDDITIDVDGRYAITCGFTMDGENNAIVGIAVFKNGVLQENLATERQMDAGSDIGGSPLVGLLDLVGGDVLDVRVTSDGNGNDVTPYFVNLSIVKTGATGSGGGGGDGNGIYGGSGTLPGDVIVDLGGNNLEFSDPGGLYFKANIGDDAFQIQTAGGYQFGIGDDFSGYQFNAPGGNAQYTADNHTFNGNVNLPSTASGATTDSVLTINSSTGLVTWRDAGSFVFANNGLTKDADTVKLGGTLTKNTSIDINSFNIKTILNPADSNNNNFTISPTNVSSVIKNATNRSFLTDYASVITLYSSNVAVTKSAQVKVRSDDTQVFGDSASVYMGASKNNITSQTFIYPRYQQIEADSIFRFIINNRSTPSNNTVLPIFKLERDANGGVGVNGIGSSIDFTIRSGGVFKPLSNSIISKLTDVTSTLETSEFSITGISNGTINTLLTISGAGIFTLVQSLPSYANNAAAISGGLSVNQLYRISVAGTSTVAIVE